ncbi:hypothetical protein TNIN_263771 [Trichonephila inaurata madagascariensis]|uniref:Uncharacterized protein n=1 Tax=Trichonephila inaurata madagascariensis TaxID=2747483 RepID=A0A8X6Y9G2_9ARAC|nr:hypothetical protein TNIN_263771 [Trichonephila inaurata madagascariensis]
MLRYLNRENQKRKLCKNSPNIMNYDVFKYFNCMALCSQTKRYYSLQGKFAVWKNSFEYPGRRSLITRWLGVSMTSAEFHNVCRLAVGNG